MFFYPPMLVRGDPSRRFPLAALVPDFALWKLDSLAMLGYAAFALDMFGTGHALWNRPESVEARRPLTDDRSRMQARAMAALLTLRGLPGVDPDRIAAIGYCFGGMTVLDLARLGAPPGLRAVCSLHGDVAPIAPSARDDAAAQETPIRPKVLVLHAEGDPFVTAEEVGWIPPESRIARRNNAEVTQIYNPIPSARFVIRE